MSKILIVEDEIDMLQIYVDKFTQEGFKISSARTSEEGLKKAKEEKPDLIILDILLPTENGISFLGKLRKDPKTREIEVVALSNYDEPRTRKEAQGLGAKDYLIKTDYTPKELVEKIRNYLPC